MIPFIDWHNISHILRQYTTCLNLLPIDFDYFQSQNSDRAQNIYPVTLHEQLKGIITYKIIRLTTLMKKGGINHLKPYIWNTIITQLKQQEMLKYLFITRNHIR